jgi:hypothetical protein
VAELMPVMANSSGGGDPPTCQQSGHLWSSSWSTRHRGSPCFVTVYRKCIRVPCNAELIQSSTYCGICNIVHKCTNPVYFCNSCMTQFYMRCSVCHSC